MIYNQCNRYINPGYYPPVPAPYYPCNAPYPPPCALPPPPCTFVPPPCNYYPQPYPVNPCMPIYVEQCSNNIAIPLNSSAGDYYLYESIYPPGL